MAGRGRRATAECGCSCRGRRRDIPDRERRDRLILCRRDALSTGATQMPFDECLDFRRHAVRDDNAGSLFWQLSEQNFERLAFSRGVELVGPGNDDGANGVELYRGRPEERYQCAWRRGNRRDDPGPEQADASTRRSDGNHRCGRSITDGSCGVGNRKRGIDVRGDDEKLSGVRVRRDAIERWREEAGDEVGRVRKDMYRVLGTARFSSSSSCSSCFSFHHVGSLPVEAAVSRREKSYESPKYSHPRWSGQPIAGSAIFAAPTSAGRCLRLVCRRAMDRCALVVATVQIDTPVVEICRERRSPNRASPGNAERCGVSVGHRY